MVVRKTWTTAAASTIGDQGEFLADQRDQVILHVLARVGDAEAAGDGSGPGDIDLVQRLVRILRRRPGLLLGGLGGRLALARFSRHDEVRPVILGSETKSWAASVEETKLCGSHGELRVENFRQKSAYQLTTAHLEMCTGLRRPEPAH